MGSPQMGAPQIGGPQIGSPQMGAPQMGGPQMGGPQATAAPAASGGNQGGSPGRVVAMLAVAIAAGLGIAGATWFAFFRDSSPDPDPVVKEEDEDGDESDDDTIATMADFETCKESKYLSIPGTDISIEPVTYDEEVEFAEEHRSELESAIDLSPKDDPENQKMLEDLVDELKPDDAEVPYTITLIENEMVNAFILPGGEIFATDALVDLMTEDELSFVIGHELSHGLCRHPAQSMERVELVEKATETANEELDLNMDDVLQEGVAQTVYAYGNLSFSREDEYEADRMAIVLMRETDRPLDAAVTSFEKLQSLENEDGTPTMEVLSTHPITEKRIEAVQYQIDNG